MPNMQIEKTKMPEQDPRERVSNFDEVALGYTPEMAVNEAKRCLNCKHKPCVGGCPVNIEIPEFISHVANGDFLKAYEVIKRTNSLPAVCGRVCPQETQCEARCVRGIKNEPVAIGRLERFVADYAMAQEENKAGSAGSAGADLELNGIKIAVVGAGPAGLTCAGDLRKRGYEVTVFEAFHMAGGVLVYGIPEFRLPKEIVSKEIKKLEASGVKIVPNCIIGKTITVDELFEQGYRAVFIGSGAGLPSFMDIPGENLNGVYSANEFLTRINLMKAYRDDYDTPVKRHRRVGVVGGGNVAMDAARSALRLGAEQVIIIYRRGRDELPARAEEVHHALEEGVQLELLTNPVEIIGDENGAVKAVRCVRMELGEPDSSGRRRPVEIKGSKFEIGLDAVIVAIGTSPNPLIRMTTQGLQTNNRGCIVVEESTGATSRENVYAGGDAVTGAATVILAMGAGKKAAAAIDEMIKKQEANKQD
jgi:glutamate synthase (NADPH/NADH) small chain